MLDDTKVNRTNNYCLHTFTNLDYYTRELLMHVVTWIDMMDMWGNVAPQSDWKQKQWTGQFLKEADQEPKF